MSSVSRSPNSGRMGDRQLRPATWGRKESEWPGPRQGPAQDALLQRLQPPLRQLQPLEGPGCIYLPRAGRLVKENQNQPGGGGGRRVWRPHGRPGPRPSVCQPFPRVSSLQPSKGCLLTLVSSQEKWRPSGKEPARSSSASKTGSQVCLPTKAVSPRFSHPPAPRPPLALFPEPRETAQV